MKHRTYTECNEDVSECSIEFDEEICRMLSDLEADLDNLDEEFADFEELEKELQELEFDL